LTSVDVSASSWLSTRKDLDFRIRTKRYYQRPASDVLCIRYSDSLELDIAQWYLFPCVRTWS